MEEYLSQSSADWSDATDDVISGASAPAPAPAPRPTPAPSAPAPVPAAEPTQVPWPAPAAVPSNLSTYENVYCSDVEGKLEVSDEGLKFIPYVPSKVPTSNITPYDILWKGTTHSEFYKEDVKAGYGSYQTFLTFFNLKVGIWPSKEAVFSTRQQGEYERLQCDLDARGYGAQEGKEHAGFHPDGYDHAEAVYNDMEEEVHWKDEDPDVDESEHGENGMRQTATERPDKEDGLNLGWSAADIKPTPNSSYYPVNCKREIGILVLTGRELKFVPDRHSATVKTIPWAAFAGRPFFSPWNYPRAQMAIHYHTTRGPDKKVGFDLVSQEELLRLEDDLRERMRPFKNAPREKVYLPPKMTKEEDEPSVSKPRGGGGAGGAKKPKPFKKNKTVPPAPWDVSHTEETTSFGGGHEGPITAATLPLVANTARRVPYHKDESNRRLFLLFMAYCCIATLAGLTFSILFGNFFGPRRPKEQYVRTASPHEIGADYLGSKPPTMAPTQRERDEWNSDAVTMSRSMTEPPEPATPLEQMRGNTAGRRPGSSASGGGVRESEFELSTMPPNMGEIVAEAVPPTSAPTTMTNTVRTEPLDLETPVPTTVETTLAPITAPTAPEALAPTTKAPTAVTTTETPTPTLNPTAVASPQETRSSKSIAELLMEKSPDQGVALRTPNTPQQAAYLLMKVSGLLDSAPSDDMIIQKYALSTLYYAADGEDWNEGSTTWKDLVGSDCLKQHVVCDEATQKALWIDMPHNKMQGHIPPEVGLLDSLTHINFKGNDLRGAIPTEIGLLKNLEVLDLSGNPKLEGGIPDEVRSLPLLTEVKADLH